MVICLFIHLSLHFWGLFLVLAIANQIPMNIHIQVFVWTYAFTGSRMTGSYGVCTWHFYETVKQLSNFTFLWAAYENCSSSTASSTLGADIFIILSMLIVVCCCLILVLICIYLTTNAVEHLFICFVSHVYSLVKYLFEYFAHCIIWSFYLFYLPSSSQFGFHLSFF